jgi:DNA-3-methyladenine glycosylase I
MANRCTWADSSDEMRHYHDTEWGVPVHDDLVHFEFITLEGAQAGLSWATILKRRAGYRKAFSGFDPRKVSRFDTARIDRLVLDEGIIRHRGKIESVVSNAHAFLAVQKEFGSFDAYIWSWVEGKPIVRDPASHAPIPATTPLSDRISKDLKKRGFKFVGSTIVYAYMQAVGLVNDHMPGCYTGVQT